MSKLATACLLGLASICLMILFGCAIRAEQIDQANKVNLPKGVHYEALTSKPGFESGIYTAGAGLITTTVQKTLLQNYLTFPSLSYTITGSQAPVVDFTLGSGSVLTLPDAIGVVNVANLQMLTVWTDSLDVTLSANTTSSFGTSAGTLAVKQGTPYEWDISSGTAIPGFTNWQSFSVTAGTKGSLSGGTATATNIHMRSSLSQ